MILVAFRLLSSVVQIGWSRADCIGVYVSVPEVEATAEDVKKYVDTDPNFSRLKSEGVSFYDPEIEAPTKKLLQPTATSSPYG